MIPDGVLVGLSVGLISTRSSRRRKLKNDNSNNNNNNNNNRPQQDNVCHKISSHVTSVM